MKNPKNERLIMNSLRNAYIAILVFLAAVALTAGSASATLTAKANHDHIKVDFFYHGSTVSVSGVKEPGTDLIIKIASPEGHEVLKQKGKAAGLLWMNVGTLKFEKTPNLYEIHSTKKPEELISQDAMDKYVIGYPALGRHVEITPASDETEKAKWFGEFVKFKESKKLYDSSYGNISIQNQDGKEKYYILTQWPYQAPPGDYTVTVYEIKNGKVIDTAEAKVDVEQVGIVRTLAGMSKDNAVLYGIISILSALGAGFGVGLVFRKGGGAH